MCRRYAVPALKLRCAGTNLYSVAISLTCLACDQSTSAPRAGVATSANNNPPATTVFPITAPAMPIKLSIPTTRHVCRMWRRRRKRAGFYRRRPLAILSAFYTSWLFERETRYVRRHRYPLPADPVRRLGHAAVADVAQPVPETAFVVSRRPP